MEEKLIGYKMTRPSCPGWMFLGVSPDEVANAIRYELERQEGMSAEECGDLEIRPFETTQSEIDSMPEFQGW